MELLDGRRLAAQRRERLGAYVADHLQRAGRPPGLTVLVVGDDPASATYVRAKERACTKTGIHGSVQRLSKTISESELLARIAALNADPDVDAILVQLPLPAGLDAACVLDTIAPEKDVDGFHPHNSGLLWQQRGQVAPCTPLGVIHLLDHHRIALAGLNAVIVGRSNIVGRPMAELLLQRHATVTIAHSRTRDLDRLLATADLIVAAIGRPGFIRPEQLKRGVICIDVGINRTEAGLVGDFQWEGLEAVAAAATPVPGGVGPMTIATLLHNTVCGWARHRRLAAPPS
jgi:methylenetetrahydrofolate dehydrogenase (NADP+)/methenyltetrahydrofolate cyclohydrolase